MAKYCPEKDGPALYFDCKECDTQYAFQVSEKYGEKTEWREELEDEERDPDNRKRIRDFGCYLVSVHALNAR